MESKEKAVLKTQLKSMSLKEKIRYFWYYYKIHTLVAIVALIAIGALIRDIVTSPPDAVFYGEIINASPDFDYDAYAADFAAYAGIDTTQASVIMDTSIYTTSSDLSSMTDVASAQKMMALASTSTIDVIISNESMTAYYAGGGYFLDLRKVLPAQYLEKYEDFFYYYTYDEAAQKAEAKERGVTYESSSKGPFDTTEPVPVGIRQSAFASFPPSRYTEETILSFCTSSEQTDMALKYLDFLQQYQPDKD